jgi:hypothetical protein
MALNSPGRPLRLIVTDVASSFLRISWIQWSKDSTLHWPLSSVSYELQEHRSQGSNTVKLGTLHKKKQAKKVLFCHT